MLESKRVIFLSYDTNQTSTSRLYEINRVKDISFLDTCDGLIRKFYDYWQSCHHNDDIVLKSSMVPEGMIELLTRIFIVEKEPINDDYRYRLIGSEELSFRKNNPTGQLVKDGHVGTLSDALTNYDYVFKQKSHLFMSCNIFRSERYLVTYDTLFLPVSKKGIDVDFAYALSIRKVDMVGDGHHRKTDRLIFDAEGYGL